MGSLPTWMHGEWIQFFMIVGGGVLGGGVTWLMMYRVLSRLTGKTPTDIDDFLVRAVRGPLTFSVVLLSIWYATKTVLDSPTLLFVVRGVLVTSVVLYWTISLAGFAKKALSYLGQQQRRIRIVQERTLPLFEFLSLAFLIGMAFYFIFLVWRIDMSAWIASAGIVGIAVGFGAKDTLANLFAGIFIIADAPYKIGDYLVLETGERGRVTDIGLRSTRIITLDEVQIIVPNAVIGTSQVTNQSGGKSIKTRLSIPVGVSYESDIDEVRQELLDVAASAELVLMQPAPVARLMEMADSALVFHLFVWIANPVQQDAVIDDVHSEIVRRFRAKSIEIPYPKQDLYVRELPAHSGEPPFFEK